MKKHLMAAAAAAFLAGGLMMADPVYAQSVKPSGWQMENDIWYYYQDGMKLENSWVLDGEIWYYLGSGGAMAADTVTPDGYCVDQNGAWVKEKYDGLIKEEYPALAMNVVLSGSTNAGETAVLTINLKNEGQRTIVYTKGSGSFITPQALMVKANGLQPIIPEDYLGPATADFRREQLKPGEELSFTMYVRLIKPAGEFDTYTYQRREHYIGDIPWVELRSACPDLTAADTGAYRGQVYFLYSLLEEGPGGKVFGEDTGYNTVDFNIVVSE